MENIDDVYKKYANVIKNYIFSITENESLSEEIMQETFIVAINQINNFRGECEISVWLRSIAKKILYKETKKNNSKIMVPIDELEIKDKKNIEKIYIEDTEHNLKEIWNKDMNVQTEEEWKKWYIDNYVPEEIKEQYKMNYDNISVDVTIWKKLYNMSIKK